MKLHHRILGEGQPLIILHGLFGSSDNWQTHAKKLAEYFQVVLVDQRNHGHSGWSDDFSYELMAEDLNELIGELGFGKVLLLGHSMGGKTIMRFAQLFPGKIEKMIVADMGIRSYPPHHQDILAGLGSVDLEKVKTRGEVEEILKPFVPNDSTRAFLMKNLYWVEKGKLGWRMNTPVLEREMPEILKALPQDEVIVPALFLTGGESGYVSGEDHDAIEEVFPDSTFVEIAGAGHWVHAEAPEEFLNAVLEFLLR
jgi:esterase